MPQDSSTPATARVCWSQVNPYPTTKDGSMPLSLIFLVGQPPQKEASYSMYLWSSDNVFSDICEKAPSQRLLGNLVGGLSSWRKSKVRFLEIAGHFPKVSQ